VLIVVYVFLQSFRATIIPMLTVPVSLLGAFIAFPLLGFSVNTLTDLDGTSQLVADAKSELPHHLLLSRSLAFGRH
jgi:hypothetical protein